MKRCACLLMQDPEGRFLLQMRDNAPGIAHPLMWDFFGGGVEADESVQEAAARECREELAIDVTPDELAMADTWVNGDTEETLLCCRRRVVWGDFRVLEGAGAAFFRREEVSLLQISSPVREFLVHRDPSPLIVR